MSCGPVWQRPVMSMKMNKKKSFSVNKMSSFNYTCPVCDKGYVKYASFYTHKKTHDDVDYPCKKCGKVYKRLGSMKLHSYGCKAAEKPAEKVAVVERKEPPANKLSNYMFNLE